MKKKKMPNKNDAGVEINENDLEFTKNPGDENASDPFLNSLDKLSEKDIPTDSKPKAKKKKKASLLTSVILGISCAVFVGCAVYLVFDQINKKVGGDMYDEMADKYFDGISFVEEGEIEEEEEKDTGAVRRLSKASSASKVLCLSDRIALGANVVTGNYDEQLQQMRASLTALSEQNPDTYGWIQVPGTRINYPITQSNDNDWYLKHAHDGSYSVLGSVFADYRNNTEIYRNFNTVLYGHNITDGKMFHDVEMFYNDEEFFQNTLIYVYTMDGVYVYEPFAIYLTEATYNYFRTEFGAAEHFVDFAYMMKSNSKYEKDMDFVRTDRMLTLSTCKNSFDQIWRYSLQAKLVQVIN